MNIIIFGASDLALPFFTPGVFLFSSYINTFCHKHDPAIDNIVLLYKYVAIFIVAV